LRERRQYLDSALVFSDLVNKPEERFLSLCKARAWDEASRVVSLFEISGSGTEIFLTQKKSCINFNSVPDQLLKFEVTNHHSSLMGDLATAQEQVTQYTARLLIVRAEKAKRLEEEGGKYIIF